MNQHADAGFSLIEVTLAVTVGFMVMAASVYAYNQISQSSRVQNAKAMVGTIQGNLAMEKFRLGTPPPMTPKPSASPVFGLSINRDSTGKPYAPMGGPTSFPADPIKGVATILPYRAEFTPIPLSTGAPSERWDNPVFATPGAAAGYGKGGWLYDEYTGAFRINVSNAEYPDQRPAAW